MKNLEIEYKNLENDLDLEVILKGQFVSLRAIEFKNYLLDVLCQKRTDCYVDISQVNKMDVTGVNALVMAHKMAIRNGNKVFVLNEPNSQAEEFLHLTKFVNIFNYSKAIS